MLALGCTRDSKEIEFVEETPVIDQLPFTQFGLTDMSGFQPVGKNWSIAGKALSDFTVAEDLQKFEGQGILVNIPTDSDKDNIFTAWEHGDIELEIEVMVPKGSNSGIYLQSRYEIQVFDSWQKESPTFADCGGIYQRWKEDAPAGQQGFEGHPPRINMAKAPGLWQKFYIIYRAPRFDAAGNKTENARFEKVMHNGKIIHENVELSGPTRAAAAEDEVSKAPLMLQGDHGPVAYRNFRYKVYFDEVLEIQDLNYEFYNLGSPLNEMPSFDTLELAGSGKADSLDVEKYSDVQDYYALRFTGKLSVPKTGDYLLHIRSDDGAQLFIDGQKLIDNNYNHGMDERPSGFISLTAGMHDLQLDYYNNTWGKGLVLLAEGPEMKYQPLLSKIPKGQNRKAQPLVIKPEQSPELVRCFTTYANEKRTHVMAVGHPLGVHFAIDLNQGTLLKFWRGRFADVANMWRNRGISQLLIPLELSVEGSDGPIAAQMVNSESTYPEKDPAQIKLDRYELDESGAPTFHYNLNGAMISDHYGVNDEDRSLERTVYLRHNSNGDTPVYCRLAASDYIDKLPNGYYNIGGEFYIKIDDKTVEEEIRTVGNQKELLFSVTAEAPQNSLTYRILW